LVRSFPSWIGPHNRQGTKPASLQLNAPALIGHDRYIVEWLTTDRTTRNHVLELPSNAEAEACFVGTRSFQA
jgi:hypothetical protein